MVASTVGTARLLSTGVGFTELFLVLGGGIGFLFSFSAMARAVGIETPDQQWRRRRSLNADTQVASTDEVLRQLSD